MPSQFLTAGLRLTRRALGVLRGMAMLLTGSVLLRGITLTFALVHFAISGSDSLVELCALSARPAARAPSDDCGAPHADAEDQFGWEVLQWGEFAMLTRFISMATLVFLFPILKRRFGEGVCLLMAVAGRERRFWCASLPSR